MYLNRFALDGGPLDLTTTEQFSQLLESARELGLPVTLPLRCDSRNVIANGLRVHFLEWGPPDAPPVGFIHGFNQSAHNWDLIALALADRFHVIVPDLRGHGDSEWPRDGDTTRRAIAADLRGLVSSLGLQGLGLVGLGLGGMIAVHMLLDDPTVAGRIVLEDAAIGASISGERKEEGERIGSFLGGPWEFASQDEYIERVAAFDPLRSREHIRRTLPFNLLQRVDGKLASKHDRRRLTPEPALADSPLGLEELGRVTCPVLVVRGEHSRMVSPEAVQQMVDVLPKGRLATIPDAAHNPHSHNAAGFIDAVAPFLEGRGD